MLKPVKDEEYYAPELGLVSKSALGPLSKSPAHYRAWLESPSEPTEALLFGRALHMAVLEPERFRETYVVEPHFGDLRAVAGRTTTEQGRANKARKVEWLAEHEGVERVTADWWESIVGISASIAQHPIASRILRDGQPELGARWTDEETGLECRCRPDYYVAPREMAADLKSTLDASPRGFAKACAKYNYHWQDALYRAGIAASGSPIKHFVFIAVEKVAPYAVGVYSLSPDDIEKGHDAVRRHMDTMAECMRTGEWPAYAPGIQTIELPPWAA